MVMVKVKEGRVKGETDVLNCAVSLVLYRVPGMLIMLYTGRPSCPAIVIVFASTTPHLVSLL